MDDRPGRRERTKAQNRETILAAARGVFTQMGFAGATVRDVIRATPLASGTFYNYFKSKEEVYQALRDQLALSVRPQLREARQAATTGEAFVDANFRTFFEFIAARRGEAAPETSRFRMDSPEVLTGFTELTEDITRAMARGLFAPLDAGLLSAALAGIAFELGEHVKLGADVEAVTAFATRLAMGGIRSLPGAAPRPDTPPIAAPPPPPAGADSPS
ncbi:MAG TPA: TetR/AcrR family transcriptional regulator [Rhizomicrobium sp.]|jgi:AcrR family transcriptional regulator|nr:TetR/AcrR family transcriptional regulator [Rhizomicrobium sp.]